MVNQWSDQGGGSLPESPLLERSSTLRVLTAALRGAAEGTGGLVLISGEAGVGKTSVVRRFAVAAQTAARVLVGSCEPLNSPRPLAPLLDVLPRMGTAVPDALARVREGCPAAELFDCVLAELAGHHRPSVLVFDDLHWADEATLDLVRYLARRLGQVPALLVVIHRDDEIGRTHPLSVLLGDLAPLPGIERVALSRLSRAAVAELSAGRDVDVERLYAVTSGNPFFVTEVLAAPAGAMPATVRAAVQGRLARLSSAGLAVVEALAVLGTSARLDLVADLVADAHEGLSDALERGLLIADASIVGFRHELARRAVLDSIPSFRQADLHREMLAILLKNGVDDDQLPALVEHAEGAGDETAVLHYAPLAGQRAAALGAHREAATHYERALQFANRLPSADQVELLERAHLEYCLVGELNNAIDCGFGLVALHSARGDGPAAGGTLHALAHTLWLNGRTGDATQIALASVRILEQLPLNAELARGYAYLTELAFFAHDTFATTHYAALARNLTEQLGLHDVQAWVRFFETTTRMLYTDESYGELLGIRDEVVANDWLPKHMPRMILVPPCMATYRHDPARALPMLDEAWKLILDRDMLGFLPYLRGCRAYALLQAGDWAAAEAEARALHVDPRWSVIPGIASPSVLGVLRARRGEPEVWPVLDEALALLQEPDLLRLGPVYEARAEAAWLAGDNERAIAEAQRGLTGASPTADPWQAGPLACWIFRAGGRAPSVPTAQPYAMEIAGDWAGAATAYEARGLPWEAALARLGGDAGAVRAALLTFTRLGAQPAATRARARLRTLGERRGTRTPWAANRHNPFGLTHRQLEVHTLLAEGLTNSEIAAELVLSRNTVNHHVTAILTKLDVPNRTAAAGKLAKRGPTART
ncbi:MAG TPA: AAA family ATPase [Pseudonocardia sp.]|uniref:ATP-binding protein n=1 Tax=Pseudonocardia sp. TaxID=60912 RepID=UPI002ED7D6F9